MTYTTLQQQLADLPAHVTIDFRAIPVQGRAIWYACWRIGNKPFSRRLGEDTHGLIAREQARRGTSVQRIEEAQPSTRAPHRPHSLSQSGDYRECEHRSGRLSLACETCRTWQMRKAPRRITAMVWR